MKNNIKKTEILSAINNIKLEVSEAAHKIDERDIWAIGIHRLFYIIDKNFKDIINQKLYK